MLSYNPTSDVKVVYGSRATPFVFIEETLPALRHVFDKNVILSMDNWDLDANKNICKKSLYLIEFQESNIEEPYIFCFKLYQVRETLHKKADYLYF